jgi:hypothetical protein
MGEVNNATTGAAMYRIDGDGLYSAITGRKVGTIIGGGGAGGAAMQLVSADSTITALSANRYYQFSAPVSALNIATVETSVDEIVLRFTAGDGASISFPASLAWINEPSFEAGKTYLISIVNNIAVAAEVTV